MKNRPLLNARVTAVIENEWSQLLRNKVVIFTTLAPPLLLLAVSLAVLALTTFVGANLDEVGGAAVLAQGNPSVAALLSRADSVRVALLSPFLVLFQLIPLIVPITVASYSIIGEKQSRSLEPLLATPIHTWELLLGKALAAAIPGVLATWYSFLTFAVVARLVVDDAVFLHLVLGPAWLLSITLLTPLFALLAVGLGILISSRVRDPQSAQQLGSLVILPLIGALVGQVTGAIDVNAGVVAGVSLALMLVDALVLVVAVRLFERENILTKWR